MIGICLLLGKGFYISRINICLMSGCSKKCGRGRHHKGVYYVKK
jgi:hypothetical protein